MNDLATYEIFWHFLYLAVFHGVELTDDGRMSKKGDRVTPELFAKLLDERRETVKQLFSKLQIAYENTNAELVLNVLQRQVVTRDGRGQDVPQPRWIKYGSRVLLSIIEEPQKDREVILEAIFLDGRFGKREDITKQLQETHVASERQQLQKALRAHDFVYDIYVQ